jgi:hypothetical protein
LENLGTECQIKTASALSAKELASALENSWQKLKFEKNTIV